MDLYPATRADKPACTSDEFFNGANPVVPIVVPTPAFQASFLAAESTQRIAGEAPKNLPAAAPVQAAPLSVKAEGVNQLSENEAAKPNPIPAGQTTKLGVPLAANSPEGVCRSVGEVKAEFKSKHVSTLPSFRFTERKQSTVLEDLRSLNMSLPSETTLLQVTSKFILLAITGPGGRIGVWPLQKTGRLPHKIPCFICGSDLTDFKVDPFSDGSLVTLSDDGYLRFWTIPHAGLDDDMTSPVRSWRAHEDRGGLVQFSESVKNLLLTTSNGRGQEIKIWDAKKQEPLLTIAQSSTVLAAAFDPLARHVAILSRDKYLRVYNLKSGECSAQIESHEGTKGAQVVWSSDTHILSIGFARANMRELKLFRFEKQLVLKARLSVDTSTNQPAVYYDSDLELLFLHAKGDNAISLFSISSTEDSIKLVEKFIFPAPQFGCSFIRKELLDIPAVEFNRAWRVTPTSVETVSFSLPRQKKQYFQDDVYPPTKVVAPLEVDQWQSGGSVSFSFKSLCPAGMQPISAAPATPPSEVKSAKPRPVVEQEDDYGNTMMAKLRKLRMDEEDDDEDLPQDKNQGANDDEWDD
ncbi:hypothetical protein HDU96_007890 [Phlyctochytrium bullatum]|nr:hypothetical protein HDU96_007890 [Phlyctochytrium bullatum]